MKKIFIISGLLIMTITAFAQSDQYSYRPFAEDGKVWTTQVGGIMENTYENRIDGDTLISGERWMKVHNSVCYWSTGVQEYYSAICDKGKKVYAIAKGSNRQRLLYDFSLQVGDMVRCGVEGNAFGCLLEEGEKPDTLLGFPFVSYLRVDRIDTIEAHGHLYRRFTLTLLDSFREYYRGGPGEVIDNVIWIEGIGSAAGPFSPWMPRPAKTCISVVCEDANRDVLISYSDFYDNQHTKTIRSAGQNNIHTISLYDLQGRRTANPSKGLYIKDGRKQVMR